LEGRQTKDKYNGEKDCRKELSRREASDPKVLVEGLISHHYKLWLSACLELIFFIQNTQFFKNKPILN
jgi:hypothetical protein